MNMQLIGSAATAATHKSAWTARWLLSGPDNCGSWLRRSVALLLLLAVGTGFLSACATVTEPRKAFHSFSFIAFIDSPGIEVLDYRYGAGDDLSLRAPQWQIEQGKVSQQTGVTGLMPVGEELYVKWRVRATNEVFSETVNLRGKFPKDMRGMTVEFTISGPLLRVFLVTPDLRKSNEPVLGPRRFDLFRVLQVHPAAAS